MMSPSSSSSSSSSLPSLLSLSSLSSSPLVDAHPDARIGYARALRHAYRPERAAFPAWTLDWFEQTIDDADPHADAARTTAGSFASLARDVTVFVQRSSLPSSASSTTAALSAPLTHARDALDALEAHEPHEPRESHELREPNAALGAFVWRLLAQREPVNIAMQRLFNGDVLRTRLPPGLYPRDGTVVSYYHEWSARHAYRALPPNIAVYCRTPFDLRADLSAPVHVPAREAGIVSASCISHADRPTPTAFSSLVHVINVIGYALDHPTQADYQYFCGTAGNGTPGTDADADAAAAATTLWTRLHHAYRIVFDHIFECTLALPAVREVVFPRFGLGAFAGLLSPPQRARLSTEWHAALRASAEAYQARIQRTRHARERQGSCQSVGASTQMSPSSPSASLSLSLMGCDDAAWFEWKAALRSLKQGFAVGACYGYLPEPISRAVQRAERAAASASASVSEPWSTSSSSSAIAAVPSDTLLSHSLDQLLVVNAWDPHSIVGNGNALDQSVDGHMGRRSALALLCWPPANPHIRLRVYEKLPGVRPTSQRRVVDSTTKDESSACTAWCPPHRPPVW